MAAMATTLRTLRSNRLHSLLSLPLVPRGSSRAACSLAVDPAAQSAAAEAKPRSLSSIFSKPSTASPPRPPSGSARILKKVKKNCLCPSSRPGAAPYRPIEEKEFPKELSPEVALLVSRLYEEGFLEKAEFSQAGEFDPQKVPRNHHSRHFLKTAAERFGKDHQEIAKWLSGGDLKKVALFGCPSIERGTVFAAKRLRTFFHIQEEIVCRGCALKSSCKFMNLRVGKEEKVILADLMRILALLALDSVPRLLPIPYDVKLSVGKLLKDVVNLSS